MWGRSDDLRLWPTAAPTATPADRGGRRRAEAAEASRSKTPTNGAELRKQSLKTEVTGPRGPENGLAVRPFPQTEEVTAGRAASGGLPTRQVVAEDGPRPSTRAGGQRGHLGVTFVGWGVLAKLGWDRGPQSLQHRSPPADLPGGLSGAGYWRSSGRTLAAWGPFGPDVTSNSTAWPSSSER